MLSSMYSVDKITKLEDFLMLASDWEEAIEKSTETSVFLTFEFIRAEWENLGWESISDGDISPLILIVRNGEEIAGIFPFLKEKTVLFGLPVLRLRAFGNLYLDRTAMILVNNHQHVIEKALWFLMKEEGSWNIIYLQNVSPDTLLAAYIEKCSRSLKIKLETVPGYRSPYIARHSSWQEYFALRSSNFHKQIKNKTNSLNKKVGNFSVFEYRTPEDVDQAMSIVFKIDSNSWKGNAHTSLSATVRSMAYWKILTKYLADKGRVRIWILWVNADPVAFEYHVKFDNKIYSMKWSYDNRFQKYSPGLILKLKSTESFWNEGIDEIDLLGIEDHFKLTWSNSIRHHDNIYLFNNTAYSTLALVIFRIFRTLAQLKQPMMALWRQYS
jgi:hypothetical protein